MIYLASPYSHPDPKVRERRYWDACAFTAKRMREGAIIYSPIASSHVLSTVYGLPTHFAFWERFDKAILDRCTALEVLMLEGWQDSVGVTAEIKYAAKLGLPITYKRPYVIHTPGEGAEQNLASSVV